MRVCGRASVVARQFVDAGMRPFYGTPCGILAPLYDELERAAGLLTVPREDKALGLAAGAALAGRSPVVLMQNSGFGQSVNAVGSLILPYRLPVLMVISLRGVGNDTTQENAAMGAITEVILERLDVCAERVSGEGEIGDAVASVVDTVQSDRRPAALLVAPDAFGWTP